MAHRAAIIVKASYILNRYREDDCSERGHERRTKAQQSISLGAPRGAIYSKRNTTETYSPRLTFEPVTHTTSDLLTHNTR